MECQRSVPPPPAGVLQAVQGRKRCHAGPCHRCHSAAANESQMHLAPCNTFYKNIILSFPYIILLCTSRDMGFVITVLLQVFLAAGSWVKSFLCWLGVCPAS